MKSFHHLDFGIPIKTNKIVWTDDISQKWKENFQNFP